LRHEGFDELDRFVAAVAKSGHELRAHDDALDFVAGWRDAQRRRRIALDDSFRRGVDDPALKKLLNVPLYAYQAEGALFAVRAGRALIGDEMGLGKTIQAIAAAQILSRHFGVTKVLVICPTSLK
jgi:SNF2 family DNA or RNA helicase